MKYIDVSEHQGVIDWKKARHDINGVIIRAGYGRGTVDKQFHRNASECNRLGIPCGAYWFSYAYTADMAKNEALKFLDVVKDYTMELPLAYDYEDDSVKNGQKNGTTINASLVKSMANSFCQTIEAAGYWCMLYTNPAFMAKYYGNLAGGRYDLWLAQWPKLVNVANPPMKCGIWQWGGSEVSGISGKVDTNEAYKDYAVYLREHGFNKLSKNWYDDAMNWGLQNGIISEKRPLDNTTRAETIQILKNFYDKFIKEK